ncbi:MAG TPA: hypothetical protein VFX45_07585 [Solirubrobacterales bacterium]|nr:hypothetical protein [Solirubrobacterales bacterium]
MSFLKKGPELKLSELKKIKVPGFAEDIYYDLKERHLLPIVALLVIGIIAAPILIGGSGGDSGEAEAEAPAAGISSSAAESAQLVAKSAPGLRDYRRRLNHLQPKDPFIQKFKEKEKDAGGGSAEGATESSEGGAGSEEVFPTEPGGAETGGEEGAPDEDGLRYFSFAIDVRITGGGQDGPRKSTVRRNLPELTMLPSRDTPAIVYMGSTKDGKKAVMTVSSDVQSIFGDAKCALGSERCELLVMEEGLPETFVYGGAGRTYKIELLKIHLVESDKLNRAPLGEPKQKGKKSQGAG